MDALLEQELKNMYDDIDGFMDAFFRQDLTYRRRKDPDSILQVCKTKDMWRKGRWKTLPQSVTFERDLYDPVVGLANAIVALEDPNAAFRSFKHGDNPSSPTRI